MIWRFHTFILLFGLISGLTGCSFNKDIHSAYAYPPIGSRFLLTKALDVLPGKAGLYIQNGQNKGGKHNRFEPFCYIRFRHVAATTSPDIS